MPGVFYGKVQNQLLDGKIEPRLLAWRVDQTPHRKQLPTPWWSLPSIFFALLLYPGMIPHANCPHFDFMNASPFVYTSSCVTYKSRFHTLVAAVPGPASARPKRLDDQANRRT